MPLPRALWPLLGQPLLRLTFHNHYALRRALLRAFGATLAPTARIRPTAQIRCPWNLTVDRETSIGDHARIENVAPVRLGAFVTISQDALLWANLEGCPMPPRPALDSSPVSASAAITIADDAWIAADAFVGPGVRVGAGALLGARATTFTDLDPWTIYGGHPARALKPRPPVRTDAP